MDKKAKRNLQPPKWATVFLRWYCHTNFRDEIAGDLQELYLRKVQRIGNFRASWLYVFNVIWFIRRYNTKGIFQGQTMLNSIDLASSYFKVASRSFVKNKVTSTINVLSLVLGIGTFLILGLFIYDEMSYDNFHPNVEQKYKLYSESNGRYGTQKGDNTFAGFSYKLEDFIPEVKQVVRVNQNGAREILIEANGKQIMQKNGLSAQPAFFTYFGFELLYGVPKNVLNGKQGIILTESLAKQYFGRTDVIGESVIKDGTKEYLVSGVAKDPPHNSHLQFSFIIPYEHPQDNIWRRSVEIYVELKEGVSNELIDEKIKALKNQTAEAQPFKKIAAIPVTDIYLKSGFTYTNSLISNVIYVYIFSSIGILVLLIAFINYTNLATATYLKRSLEMGVRKIVGASRKHLIAQLFSETFINILFSLVVALLLVKMVLPAYNHFLERQLSFDFVGWQHLFGVLVFLMLATAIAGCYPIVFLSRFSPSDVMGKTSKAASGVKTRKALIVFQFVVSQVLVVSSVVISSQMDYIRNKDLGFQKELMLIIPLTDNSRKSITKIKNETQQLDKVSSLTSSYSIPGSPGDITFFDGTEIEDGAGDSLGVVFDHIKVKSDFFSTYEMKLAEGRFLSEEIASDLTNAVLINEEAARQIGWKEPLGKWIKGGYDRTGVKQYVVGVVKNFHHESLKTQVQAAMFVLSNNKHRFLTIKLTPNNIPSTLASIENIWAANVDDHPFDYYFLDQHFDNMYRTEQRLSKIILGFTFLAVAIGFLGLFGLAIFMTKQRTKEIGIRKTFGATLANIYQLVTWDFVKLILIGIVIGSPLALYATNKWLEGFAYRVEPGFVMIGISAVFTLLVSLLAVSGQSIKASKLSPAETVKYH